MNALRLNVIIIILYMHAWSNVYYVSLDSYFLVMAQGKLAIASRTIFS